MTKTRGKSQCSDSEDMGIDDKLNKILQQVSETGEQIKVLSSKFDGLFEKYNSLETQTAKNTVQLLTVHSKVDSLEQYSKRNNLRFFGVPESADEDTGEITLRTIREKMSIGINMGDIEDAYRIGTPNNEGPRTIFVKFATYGVRQQVYKKRTSLGGTRITVREDLTRTRVEVLKFAVDKFGRNNVWTMDGRIKWSVDGKKLSATSLEHIKNFLNDRKG